MDALERMFRDEREMLDFFLSEEFQEAAMQLLDSWRDEVVYVPVIPCEDEPLHTLEHPFCSDSSCGCHQDDELIEQYLLRPQTQGLLTIKEAYRLFFDMQV